MAGISTAGVEFSRDLMRYAEVERREEQFKLVRLGSCEFGFDAAGVLFDRSTPQFMDAIREAMADIFKDTAASHFRFVIPSRRQTRFTTTVPEDADIGMRTDLVGHDARLFTANHEGGDIFPLRLQRAQDTDVHRFAVSHLDASLSRSLKQLQPVFPEAKLDPVPSMPAALAAFRQVAHHLQLSSHTYLLIGAVEEGYDVIVTQGTEPLAQEFLSAASGADLAYHALLLGHRLGLTWNDIETVFLYGTQLPEAVTAALEEAFGPSVEPINTGVVVGLERDHFGDDYPIESFLPVVGAAIQ
jgi:hypothetical protein